MGNFEIYNRADIVNFMKVNDTFKRMQGFTSGGKELNPQTYSRRYVDEKIERESTIGYSPNIPYAFDRIKDNAIHERIAAIHDDELTGETVEILTVNTQTNEGRLRTYDVNPDNDGQGTDAYDYSGNFHAQEGMTKGTATISADGLTATFNENENSNTNNEQEQEQEQEQGQG